MKKINVSKSGIFTISEYLLEKEMDPAALVRLLEAGPGQVQEIISYVFEGEDPLGIDTKTFPADEFVRVFPALRAYGDGLAFDVIMRVDGSPVTVELTNGSRIAAVNSLDAEIELGDLLGEETTVTEDIRQEEQKQEDLIRQELCQKEMCQEKRGEAPQNETESVVLTPEKLLEILDVAERLKCCTRHCDTSSGRRESVAEHSWRLALMAMLLSGVKEYDDLSLDRVIRMCLIHDLGEAFTGDIPAFEKTGAETAEEEKMLAEWVDSFPGILRTEFHALYKEMKEMKTPESKLYKALDKMEAVIQHNESDISTWLPLEYDLQRTYGQEEVEFSTFLRTLKNCVDAWTEKKIAESGNC